MEGFYITWSIETNLAIILSISNTLVDSIIGGMRIATYTSVNPNKGANHMDRFIVEKERHPTTAYMRRHPYQLTLNYVPMKIGFTEEEVKHLIAELQTALMEED